LAGCTNRSTVELKARARAFHHRGTEAQRRAEEIKSKEQRAKSKEQRAKSKEQRAKSKFKVKSKSSQEQESKITEKQNPELFEALIWKSSPLFSVPLW